MYFTIHLFIPACYCNSLGLHLLNFSRLVILQKRDVTSIHKSHFNVHFDPIFKDLRILISLSYVRTLSLHILLSNSNSPFQVSLQISTVNACFLFLAICLLWRIVPYRILYLVKSQRKLGHCKSFPSSMQ